MLGKRFGQRLDRRLGERFVDGRFGKRLRERLSKRMGGLFIEQFGGKLDERLDGRWDEIKFNHLIYDDSVGDMVITWFDITDPEVSG